MRIQETTIMSLFTTNGKVSRRWPVPLRGLILCILVFGGPFLGAPANRAVAAPAKGHPAAHAGHASKPKKHRGMHARAKRHGPNRRHSSVQVAKNRRLALRQRASSQKSVESKHSAVNERKIVKKSDFNHSWQRRYWGPHSWGPEYWGFYDAPVVIAPQTVVKPATQLKDYIVTYSTSRDGKTRTEHVRAASKDDAKEEIRKHHPNAVFQEVKLK
jgi:hypothetical protein